MPDKKKNILTCCFLVLGVALILTGIFQDQAKMVLVKAARICMECVGIG
ncbi:MAG: thioredoxin [Clostridiales bacterium]|nr:thioredoxin [Clostridiales bacterium]